MPEDSAFRDPSIPVGTLKIVVLDAFEQPIANQEVELAIVHATIATGESRESKKGTTSEMGEVDFPGLGVGSGHSYSAHVTYQGGTFSVRELRLDDRAGGVVLLHVFESTDDFTLARSFGLSDVNIGQKDDVLDINYKFTFEVPGPYALRLDLPLALPPGHKALDVPDRAVPAIVAGEQGVTFKGTLRPGRHIISFGYHLPMERDGDQSLTVPMPPRIVAASVAITASKKMNIVAEKFEPARRTYDGNASWLITQREIKSLDEGFISKVDVTITGLPGRPWGAFVTAGIAFVLVAAGGSYVLQRRKVKSMDADTVDDLEDAKKALLSEFVALERAYAKKEIGDKSYARIRQGMLDALARIEDRLRKGRAAAA